jgi:DNA-binding transcriptional LysR family regulator
VRFAADGPAAVPMNLELRHLRAFAAVAEDLNFTRAASRLHLAQQALSAQVQQLERALGVDLFVRTTRRVELTRAGQVLLSHVGPLLASVNIACEQTRRAGAGQVGKLSIAYTPTVAAETLPLLAEQVHAEHPTIKLQMVEMWQHESLAAVATGRFDVCLIRSRDAGPELESTIVRHEPLGIVLGEGHPLTRRPALRISDLGETYMTIWPRSVSPGYYDLVNDTFRSAGYDGPVREFENHTRDTWFGDAVARMEIAACRAFSVAFNSQTLPAGFVWRSIDPPPLIPLTLCWRTPASELVTTFIHCVQKVARNEGWADMGEGDFDVGASSTSTQDE